MKDRRLGCLTGSGFIAGGLTLLVVVAISLLRGGLLFSPGALNAQAGNLLGNVTSHAGTGGQCRLCHAPFWSTDTMADRCVACHTDIAAQWQDPSSLHGILRQNDPGLSCHSCHPDHRGPDAPLTEFSMSNFPHNQVGYSLAGHARQADGAPFVCSDCHSASFASFDQSVCQNCHNQIDTTFTSSHVLAFGSDCLACHDGLDTYGSDFNHNLYTFPLTGRHVDVTCSGCHPNARSIPDLQATPVDCGVCHAADDAHQGGFGTNCATCHTTDGWLPASFDHNLFTFKLEGKHVGLACESCHVNNVFQGTPTTCNACHAADDTHQGQFGTACGSCHTPAGWLPASFDHNLFTFKLEGKHVGLACESCHVNNVFQGTPTTCNACHAADDTHQGQFGTACGSCHTPAGWLPASLEHSFFPLTNGHALPCTRCHSGNTFTGLSPECVTCHADPAYHAGLFGTDCASCHNTSNWLASYTGLHPGGCGGNCLNHEGATCRDCHTTNLSTATCTKCHDSNNPGDGGD